MSVTTISRAQVEPSEAVGRNAVVGAPRHKRRTPPNEFASDRWSTTTPLGWPRDSRSEKCIRDVVLSNDGRGPEAGAEGVPVCATSEKSKVTAVGFRNGARAGTRRPRHHETRGAFQDGRHARQGRWCRWARTSHAPEDGKKRRYRGRPFEDTYATRTPGPDPRRAKTIFLFRRTVRGGLVDCHRSSRSASTRAG